MYLPFSFNDVLAHCDPYGMNFLVVIYLKSEQKNELGDHNSKPNTYILLYRLYFVEHVFRPSYPIMSWHTMIIKESS